MRVSISDKLSATSVVMVQGKTYTIWNTMTGLGSDRLSYVQEYSEDGKLWTALLSRTWNSPGCDPPLFPGKIAKPLNLIVTRDCAPTRTDCSAQVGATQFTSIVP